MRTVGVSEPCVPGAHGSQQLVLHHAVPVSPENGDDKHGETNDVPEAQDSSPGSEPTERVCA
jgi:hypothetical protein